MNVAVSRGLYEYLMVPNCAPVSVVPVDWRASREYLQRARELCNEHGALLIFDEVQIEMGRLGTLFGYERFDVVADVMTLAKDAARHLELCTHDSNFGGNPLACVVGERQ